MYRPTNKQTGLFVAGFQLSDGAQRLFDRSWAPRFREHLYPLLLAAEPQFAHLYDSSEGRPNWSVARMLGLLVLQAWFDLTDRALEEAFCFDIRFQHALDLPSDAAYLSRRSLSDFRLRLVTVDREMKLLRGVPDRELYRST